MANKFLDQNGLLYFWQKIVNKFVAKETGKGLSTNDFTNELKTKLDGIAKGANKTTVEDVLTSTSTTNALSANQGKVLSDKIETVKTEIEDKLSKKINSDIVGQPLGVASLGVDGKVPSTQLPSYVDDVVEGYAKTSTSDSGVVTVDGFYKENTYTTAIAGETGKIYVDLATNISYRYGGTTFVQITSSDMTALTNAEIDTIVAS